MVELCELGKHGVDRVIKCIADNRKQFTDLPMGHLDRQSLCHACPAPAQGMEDSRQERNCTRIQIAGIRPRRPLVRDHQAQLAQQGPVGALVGDFGFLVGDIGAQQRVL